MAEKPTRAVPTFDERTELELDHLSAIVPEDLLKAQRAWEADAKPAFKGLLGKVPQPKPPAT
jgi:hypothetical protein